MNPPPHNISRLFIEIDDRTTPNIGMLSMLACHMHKLQDDTNFFDAIIYHSHVKTDQVWNAIKQHDEIYCSTSLVPRLESSAGALFNALMEQAVVDQVCGKSIYIFREYDDIEWKELDAGLVDKALRANSLYIAGEKFKSWVKIDIDELINNKISNRKRR